MTKADLITIITDKLKFPWARAELLVDVVFGCLEQSMSRGEKIEIRATRPNYPLYPDPDRRRRQHPWQEGSKAVIRMGVAAHADTGRFFH